MKRKSTISLALLASIFTAGPVQSFSLPDLNFDSFQGLDSLTSLEGFDTITDLNVDDLSSAGSTVSDASESLEFSGVTEYLEGAYEVSSELTLLQDAINFASAGGDALSFDGAQSTPLNIVEDLLGQIAVSANYVECSQYKLLGTCWFLSGGLIPRIRIKFVAENYYPDQHLEVTPSLPTPSDTLLETYGSPTDFTMGNMVQYVVTIFSRMFDTVANGIGGISGAGSVMQLTKNKSENKELENPSSFREVMVMGNPSTLSPWSIMPGYCKASTVAYMPLYNSGLDVISWRILPITETVLTGVYAANYLEWNTAGTNFGGSVFPRTGVIEDHDPYRSSVVAAFRAASIVNDDRALYSGSAGLHVFQPASATASGSVRSAADYKYKVTQDHKALRFREVFPRMSARCTDFRWSASKVASESQTFLTGNKSESLALKVYRPFVCCKRSGKYLFSIAIPSTFN